jgi:hypothetical protein
MAFPLRREMNDNGYYKQDKSDHQHRNAYESADKRDANPGLRVSRRSRRTHNLRQNIQTPHPAANDKDKTSGYQAKRNDQQYILWLSYLHKLSNR